MTRILNRALIAFAALLFPAVFLFTQAQSPAGGVVRETDLGSSAKPDVSQLKQHVTYLAGGDLAGRKPGTAGADKAAAYVAEQFHALKLGCPEADFKCRHTGAGYNGYRQEFPFIAAVELAKNNSLSFKQGGADVSVPLRSDWMPLGFSSNDAMPQAPMVFAGYGITAAEPKHDDYASVSAKDKVALVFAGSPDGDNPHGQFARYADARWKAIAAKDRGAKALVVIVREEKFSNDRMTKLSYDQTAGEAGLPVIAISRQVAAKLFGLSDAAQLGQLEKATDKWAEAAQKLQNNAINLSVEVTRRAVPAYNVVGMLEGSDPKLKREFIVIGAHYDHLGHGGESSLAPNSSEVHHGADDNASGVAGLLELARIFNAEKKQVRRSLLFIAFSAEESGLIGSNYYVNHPVTPLADTVAMLNLDMIGRLRDGKLTVGGVGASPEFRKLIESLNQSGTPAPGFKLQLNEDGFGPSDHSSFYAKQIPVLFFFTGAHEDYHKPSDTADKINYEGQARVVSFTANIVRALDRNDARPAYALARSQSSGRAGGFRVYLGTAPNYAESSDGMLLDGVRDDSPAAKAGLKAGDKIVKMAGREIKSVY
ncbi:MAG: M20/M25/M40 family metallo-hydrolase, partial [Blastocatellia bacterium]